jgi:hypothetical protein
MRFLTFIIAFCCCSCSLMAQYEQQQKQLKDICSALTVKEQFRDGIFIDQVDMYIRKDTLYIHTMTGTEFKEEYYHICAVKDLAMMEVEEMDYYGEIRNMLSIQAKEDRSFISTTGGWKEAVQALSVAQDYTTDMVSIRLPQTKNITLYQELKAALSTLVLP